MDGATKARRQEGSRFSSRLIGSVLGLGVPVTRNGCGLSAAPERMGKEIFSLFPLPASARLAGVNAQELLNDWDTVSSVSPCGSI